MSGFMACARFFRGAEETPFATYKAHESLRDRNLAFRDFVFQEKFLHELCETRQLNRNHRCNALGRLQYLKHVSSGATPDRSERGLRDAPDQSVARRECGVRRGRDRHGERSELRERAEHGELRIGQLHDQRLGAARNDEPPDRGHER